MLAVSEPPPSRGPSPLRSAVASVRQALGNDGIRRLGLSWTLGIAADSALLVVTLVTVFNRGGVLAAGLLGAARMIPAIVAGMTTSSLLERYRGDRILVVLGLAAGGQRGPRRVARSQRPARRSRTATSR